MRREPRAVAALRSTPLHSDQSGIRRIARDIYPKARFAVDFARSFRAVALPVLGALEQQKAGMRAALLRALGIHHHLEARESRRCRPTAQIPTTVLPRQHREQRL